MTTARELDLTTLAPTRLWVPKHVLITRAAAELPHTAEIVRRCEQAGVTDIRFLPGNALTGLRGNSERETYASAKNTLGVVVAPPSALKPQPIPPSADWRIDLAKGCPAHCQYCYLAGSLQGPPVTRVYANIDDVLGGITTHAGRGAVTSGTIERGHEGTTFELSCYTDPLGIESVTGSLAAAISRVGAGGFGSDVQLRFTTKFDDVRELVTLDHGRRTRIRFSVNAADVANRFEGGTARMPARLAALRAVATAGYRVGLTIAPIMPVPGWREQYGALLDDVAQAIAGIEDLDLTAEIITHRFTPASKEVLLGWYPNTKLEMDEDARSRKRSKFGGVKYVYPKQTMAEMRQWFVDGLERRLPEARLLYWT
ncbi:radical SAM protein [Arthrobacter sp. RIT-PI-e]|uniref:spore photoproduct lyase family protein n=1 Tax=Arthrobacter sp. RIT-PI-e TaxID=1681197 RepID=UPI000675EA76|nr:radical SAM protein [Arthrobacter sp. RIT-PI-e]KNC18925.1 radical SAM protein [Arthrobacter sp. RIT-PI-e]